MPSNPPRFTFFKPLFVQRLPKLRVTGLSNPINRFSHIFLLMQFDLLLTGQINYTAYWGDDNREDGERDYEHIGERGCRMTERGV